MQNYNFLFFLSGNLTEVELPESLDKVKNLLETNGATEISFENAGRQKMAYATGTHHFGYLINSNFKIDPANLTNLKNKLSLEKEILRSLISSVAKGKTVMPMASLTVPSAIREVRPFVKKEAPVAVKEFVTETAPTSPVEEAKEEVVEEVKGEKKKAKLDLNDINKKIDEILQQDNFVV